jgi:hypothetical protein
LLSNRIKIKTKMERIIQVFNSSGEFKTVTEAEAKKIIEDTYNDGIGGLVVDMRTHEVIWTLGPEVEKIKIVQMLGGG